MATHSSIPAWRISGTEEPGGLQSMGSKRVEHDLNNRAPLDHQGSPSFVFKMGSQCWCWPRREVRYSGSEGTLVQCQLACWRCQLRHHPDVEEVSLCWGSGRSTDRWEAVGRPPPLPPKAVDGTQHTLESSLVAQMVKNLPAVKETWVRAVPGLGRCPGGGNGNPLLYSCLGNARDRGAWWVTVHRVTKSQT